MSNNRINADGSPPGMRNVIGDRRSLQLMFGYNVDCCPNPVSHHWYPRKVCLYGAFSFAERTIFQSLWRWIKRRHPQKSCGWIIKNYFNNLKHKLVFYCWIKDRSEKKRLLELIKPFLRQAQDRLS